MYFRSVRPIFSNALSRYLGGAICDTASAPFNAAPFVHLLQDMTGLTPDSVFADFLALECTFTGYLALNANQAGPVALPGVGMALLFGPDPFIADNPLTSGPQNALGYYVAQENDDPVIMFEAFPSPIPFANASDFLQLELIAPIWTNLIIP